MILRYDHGMNTHPETPRPMPGRDLKTLTAEELLALPAYVLKRFEDLARANDQAEIKEVFEDFIAFAPDLARAVIELTAKVERVEALVGRLFDAEADPMVSRGGVFISRTGAANLIRAALNGETA